MKIKRNLLILLVCYMTYSCTTKMETNPFFTEFQIEYGVPSFDKIKLEHYEPAFIKGIEEQNDEIKAIVANKETPNFENTIVALDKSGSILSRVGGVFFNMTDADTNDSIAALAMRMAPMLSEHGDNIYLNQELFKRVNTVHSQLIGDSTLLTKEQKRLLDIHYKAFVRSGAALDMSKQEKLRKINKELATLELKFSNNVLNETNAYELTIDDEQKLAGLPEWVKQSASEEAENAEKKGKWMFTLRSASFFPAMQYLSDREIRENLYTSYTCWRN